MPVILDTINLRPGSLNLYQKAFVAQQDHIDMRCRLKGAWCTDIGRLSQVWLCWETADTDIDPFVLRHDWIEHINRRHMVSVPFAPASIEMHPFNYLEIRIYRYDRDAIDEVIRKWTLKIQDRIQQSPLMFCGYTDTHPVSDWIHIWPYVDMNQRTEIRSSVIESGLWPPGAFKGLIDQESIVLKPIAELMA